MILYLHGFLSTGFSAKGQWVQQAFAEKGVDVVTPTYPIESVATSVAKLEAIIAEYAAANKPFKMVMGSSMGGFYGLYFAQKYQLPCVMINPAIDPMGLLKSHLGDYTHPSTGEKIHLNEAYLKDFEPFYADLNKLPETLLLLDEADEVIDYKIAQNYFKYHGQTLVYPSGNHAFQHLEAAWPKIITFYQTVALK